MKMTNEPSNTTPSDEKITDETPITEAPEDVTDVGNEDKPTEETTDTPVDDSKEPAKTDENPSPTTPSQPNTEQPSSPPVQPETPVEQPTTPSTGANSGYSDTVTYPAKPTYVNGILVANKKYPLPKTYAPGESKIAREAFEEMAAAARLQSLELVAFSTYRSYDRQETLYTQYVAKDGQAAADRYSARPGFSEHQTGLAFDIGEKNMEKHWASSSFGETAAGKWVAANAHNYGFIMRYPSGKEQITGYMHESWHFRYVGKDIATAIYTNKQTLEEYLHLQ
ncbi:D-alanyl-D-alanine carboxypeptidase family protein [Paenisporosarcina cavernae]|uniref:D-alanyl-D-alanine carboxypeptidase family protein n=2 Tax=Paenisporosarcina cavernae TaxID=2320858 RepID=A0A385YX53_9BACL|nr:D-alanyl-D-alanine carboxypeptidase family protein [Paenisporosarcina cavernae]